MNAYVDSSVILRVVFRQPKRLAAWSKLVRVWSSDLARVECFRVLDRARLGASVDDVAVARIRGELDELFESMNVVSIDRRILRRAAEPMPTALRTLDAIHVASALAVRARVSDLVIATHDDEMALAARALAFRVLG